MSARIYRLVVRDHTARRQNGQRYRYPVVRVGGRVLRRMGRQPVRPMGGPGSGVASWREPSLDSHHGRGPNTNLAAVPEMKVAMRNAVRQIVELTPVTTTS